MGRRGRGTTAAERVLTTLLAFALTLSGIPTQALAEAYDELQGAVGEYVGGPGDAELVIGEEVPGDQFGWVPTDGGLEVGVPEPVLTAAADAPRSGEWGECSWALDDDGTLRIWPTNGTSGKLADFGSEEIERQGYNYPIEVSTAPWREWASEVRSVEVADGVALPSNCGWMFADCNGLSALDVSGWDTSAVTNMDRMFYSCWSLGAIDVSAWDISSVTSMRETFARCNELATLDVSAWDTSSVTSAVYMFDRCWSLASLDVSAWDTSSVVDMEGMFAGCSLLSSLDLSAWDTSSVTDMDSMFARCPSLSSLDLSAWDTSSVTRMEQMFEYCPSLSSLDLSAWDTSSVTRMERMFEYCSSLSSLDLSSWDTSSVTNMWGMFRDCSSLTSLDLSAWDTSSVRDMGWMFVGCSSLKTIIVGELWEVGAVWNSNGMFSGCESLVGGNGTAYDPDHVDAEYARIDMPGTPGYLTEGASSGGIDHGPHEVTLRFASLENEPSVNLTWNDHWFSEDSKAYNHQLAQVAAVLADAAYGSKEKDAAYGSNEKLIKPDLANLDFAIEDEYVRYNTSSDDKDFYGSGYDVVAFSIASKDLGDGSKLIAIPVRGTTGNGEWSSNFNVDDANKAGQPLHEGFEKAARGVKDALDQYLIEHPEIDASKAKILVVGHSRGAAVANVLGSLLDDDARFGPDRVYAYTFAAPRTATPGALVSSSRYDNIFNVINPEDVVTMMPLAKWGYERYGVDLTLPSKTNTFSYKQKREAMSRLFKDYNSYPYYNYATGEIAINMVIWQVALRSPFVSTAYRWASPINLLHAKVVPLLVGAQGLCNIKWLNNPSVESVVTMVYGLGPEFLCLLFGLGGNKLIEYCSYLFPRETFKDSPPFVDEVVHGHTPDSYVAWMLSQDDPSALFVNAKHVRMTMAKRGSSGGGLLAASSDDEATASSPVDFRVYDASGTLVCLVENGEVDQSVLEDGLAARAADGVVTVDLPSDGSYRIELPSSSGGLVDVSLQDMDDEGAASRVSSISGVDLSAGMATLELDGLVDSLVASQGGKALPAKSFESDDEASKVDVSVSATGCGEAWGETEVLPGSFGMYVAMPLEDDMQFFGWYVDGQKVSDDLNMMFMVDGPHSIEARFAEAIAEAEVAAIPDQTYSGDALEPPVQVVLDGRALEPGVDYELSYSDNVDVGTATVTVTGTGAYAGTLTDTFAIAPRPVTVTADDKSKAYGADDPQLTATVEGTVGEDSVSFRLSRAAGEEPGAYAITPAGEAEQGNYVVTFREGTLTIGAKPAPSPDPDPKPDPSGGSEPSSPSGQQGASGGSAPATTGGAGSSAGTASGTATGASASGTAASAASGAMPKTGDPSDLVAMIGLFVVGATLVAYSLAVRRRRDGEE